MESDLLLEDGTNLLLEDGTNLLLEDSSSGTVSIANLIGGGFIIMVILLSLLISGCTAQPTVKSQTSEVRQDISAAQQSSGDAKRQIDAAQSLLKAALTNAQASAGELRNAITAAIAHLDGAGTALAGVDDSLKKTAKPLDRADQSAAHADAELKAVKSFRGLIIITIVAMGLVSVAAYCLHSITIEVFGLVGGGTIIGVALLVGEIWSHIGLLAIGLVVAAAGLFLYNAWRKGLLPALLKKAEGEAAALMDAAEKLLPKGGAGVLGGGVG